MGSYDWSTKNHYNRYYVRSFVVLGQCHSYQAILVRAVGVCLVCVNSRLFANSAPIQFSPHLACPHTTIHYGRACLGRANDTACTRTTLRGCAAGAHVPLRCRLDAPDGPDAYQIMVNVLVVGPCYSLRHACYSGRIHHVIVGFY